MHEPGIKCWCEEAIPPHSCFWIKDVLNPIAIQEPTLVVGRPTGDHSAWWDSTAFPGINDGILVNGWDSEYLYYSTAVYVANLRTEVLTNGPISVPAKTLFYARQLFMGVHWLGYHSDAKPEDYWFYPRDDSYLLDSSTQPEYTERPHALRGLMFRRVSYADTMKKCVPVVMSYLKCYGDYST